jgi:hypothetical protein
MNCARLVAFRNAGRSRMFAARILSVFLVGGFGIGVLAADQGAVHVFLLAGQSNMAGADSEVAVPPGFQQTAADRATLFTTAALPDGEKSPRYVPWGEMKGHEAKGKLVHGPEVGFACSLHAAGWKDVAIIKVYANFGRDVRDWPWGEGGELFSAWTKFVDARLAELAAEGRTPRVRGFVWHQGIDDALHGTLAAEYERNLTDLIRVLRKRYASDETPFVLARSVDSRIVQRQPDPDQQIPMAQVRRAQVKVGESVPYAAWINVDDLPNVNTHHFSADSQLIIGRRLAEAFLALQKNGPAAPAGESRGYRVLAQDKGRVAIVNARGDVEWEVDCKHNSHDIALLENGNLLLHTEPAKVVEMTPDKRVVWQHEGQPKAPYNGRVEIHAFQRLADGLTMVAESGNRRLVEVDRTGKIVKEIPLHVAHPHPHRDTRLARKLTNGNYLVCHEGDGAVREYDNRGKVVWSYALDLAGRPRSPDHGPEGHGTEVFSALRLPSGNTLIGCGNGNRVIEVTPGGKIVWSIEQNELPGITLAWVTTLQLLPSGNVIVGNTHAGEGNPQLFEVTRDKKVVWSFRDFQTFGNSLAAAMVLDVKGVSR